MSATLPTLTDSGLDDVYQWIGNLPLSKPVRNISKDLSDGVLIAEIVSHYLPRYIAVNNFTHVNSVALKRYNWETLQKMVFKYLNFQLSDEQIRSLSEGAHGIMEAFLLFLKDKIDLAVAEKRFRPSKRRTRSTTSRGSTLSLNQSDSEYEREISTTNLNKTLKNLKIASTPRSQIDMTNGQSKEEQIQKLLSQVQYLERIIDQKDEHIAALTKKVEQTNISNGTKKKQESGYQKDLIDEQSQVFMSQIHYLESVIQQKEEGIVTLSKQVDKLMGMLYPEQEETNETSDIPSPTQHRQSLRNQNIDFSSHKK
uniref:Calponin-homology (CH) domain-containing protein n=1 Tax=Panagrolaimus superbus TaxID=310955 RepID=A0A914Y2Y2_9BILA